MVLLAYMLWCTFITAATSTAPCPCVSPQQEHTTNPFVICHNSDALSVILQNVTNIMHTRVASSDVDVLTTNRCSVYINVDDIDQQKAAPRRLCPDNCTPVPDANYPSKLLDIAALSEVLHAYGDYPITCSITIAMAVTQLPNLNSAPEGAALLVIEVARHLVMECNEHAHRSIRNTHMGSFQPVHMRRKVFAVIIWVGASSNIKLIANQALMLGDEPFHGPQGVIAWAATDALYGCTKEETVCKGHLGRYKYLPHSSLNLMSVGWKCAQRRPLRALAHVLALFDPEFLVSLDDDSFFNYPLLMKRYGSYIINTMHKEPIVLGEFEGRTGASGHLTTKGIFAGGSGYIMGNKVLARLHRNETYAVGSEMWSDVPGASYREHLLELHADTYRSKEMLKFLSVLGEGVNVAMHACPSASSASSTGNTVQQGLLDRQAPQQDLTTSLNSCIFSLKPRAPPQRGAAPEKNYQTVPIGARLVDFCTNLMASPNTCQHRSA